MLARKFSLRVQIHSHKRLHQLRIAGEMARCCAPIVRPTERNVSEHAYFSFTKSRTKIAHTPTVTGNCTKAASRNWPPLGSVLLFLPAIDLPETNFDEANTPTNEMVVQEQSASVGLKCISLLKAFVPRISNRRTRVSINPSLRLAELSYSSSSPVLLSTLRC